jgi:hypothetical protein
MLRITLNLQQKWSLFFLVLVFVCASSTFSYSGDDEPLRVITETESVIPLVGVEWKISLFVEYSEVSNVFVQMPQFPDDFVRLDRVRTEPHLMNSGETWTLVEFFFIPLKPGNVILPPFEIRTPEKNAFTSQMHFRIESLNGSYVYQPELHWQSPPETIQENQSAELLLVLQNNDPQKPFDDSLPINIDIPKQAIMEKIPLSPKDKERNGILRLKIIPLKEGIVSINSIIVEYDEMLLASPSLQIEIVSSSKSNAKHNSAYTLSDEELHYNLDIEDFSSSEQDNEKSENPHFLLIPFKKQYDSIVFHINELWQSGEKVQALAEIRKAERDVTIGYFLRPLRNQFEKELELGITEDETNLPVKLLFLLSFIFLMFSIMLCINLFFSNKHKNESISFFRIVCYCIFVVIIVGSIVCGALGTFGLMKSSAKTFPHQVVLYNSNFFGIPEISGAISGSFQDGECGIIRSVAGDWLYIETSNGKSGWVQQEFVIRY